MYALNAIATAKTIIRKSKWATAVRNEKKILYEDNYELISNPKYFVFIYYLHGTCGRQHENSKRIWRAVCIFGKVFGNIDEIECWTR